MTFPFPQQILQGRTKQANQRESGGTMGHVFKAILTLGIDFSVDINSLLVTALLSSNVSTHRRARHKRLGIAAREVREV